MHLSQNRLLDRFRRQRSFNFSPPQTVVIGFIFLIAVGTGLLSLPIATVSGDRAELLTAFFTATSAVTLTGLVVVDTGSYWSGLGQFIVAGLIQAGGFGIMSLTALAGMLVTGRIGLRARRNTLAENRSLNTGDIGRTLLVTLLILVVSEAIVTAITGLRFWQKYDMSPGEALWNGFFHAISSFNNAGFGLRSDNLMSYVGDAWIILPLAASFIVGGLGFPVVAELWKRGMDMVRGHRHYRNRRLSVTTRITVVGSAVLIAVGFFMVLIFEWRNTLAGLPWGTKLLAAFFQGVTPRTAGFNSLDYAQFHPVTLMGTDLLMFIGGGSAGTAGGIKITTAVVLFAVIMAEVRGNKNATISHRTIGQPVVRQAFAVAALSLTLVTLAVGALRILNPEMTGDQVIFEVISAFATVGLSTGITAALSDFSQVILCFVMYLGRIGPVTLVVALAARNSSRRFEYPEERPFIG